RTGRHGRPVDRRLPRPPDRPSNLSEDTVVAQRSALSRRQTRAPGPTSAGGHQPDPAREPGHEPGDGRHSPGTSGVASSAASSPAKNAVSAPAWTGPAMMTRLMSMPDRGSDSRSPWRSSDH